MTRLAVVSIGLAALGLSALAAIGAMTPRETRSLAVNPALPAMDFRLVEGHGPFGLARWIQASGQIVAETPERFAAFLSQNRTEGLTVALDSTGGILEGGTRLGRLIRAAGLDTTVGRTVLRGRNGRPAASLLTHHIQCNSACSYALLGGVTRRIAPGAVIGVHQFSRPLGADGRYVRAAATSEEFQEAQRLMAELALYLEEMGIAMHWLSVASGHPYDGPPRALTPDDIRRSGAAGIVPPQVADLAPAPWSSSLRDEFPMLFRRAILREGPGLQVAEEVYLTCHRDPALIEMQLRLVLGRAEGDAALAVHAVHVDLGGALVTWRHESGLPVRADAGNRDLWVKVRLPREALLAAARSGRLAVEIPAGSAPAGRSEIAADLAPALGGLFAGCDAERARNGAS